MPFSKEKFENLQEKQFLAWAPYYDSVFTHIVYFRKVYKKLVSILREEIGRPTGAPYMFLDAACGTGEIVTRLAKLYPHTHFTGVDLSEHMLQLAREKQKRRREKRIHFARANVRHLPFQNNAFDFVLCSDALHHFSASLEPLQEMHRVLKRGGSFLLVDPSVDSWWKKIIVGFFGKVFETPKKYYTKKEVIRLLERAGFIYHSMTNFHFTNFYIAHKV